MFTQDQLKDATILKAEMMETVYLENRGSEGFVKHLLPLQAQYAPVYGIVAEDFNKDGKKDLLLAGNNTWTRIKFGRYSANHGIVLLNDGKGDYYYVPQSKSGLNLRGNVRSLKAIKSDKEFRIVAGINDGNAELLRLR